MRKLIASLAVVVVLVAGNVVRDTADPEPADAHPVTTAYTRDICKMAEAAWYAPYWPLYSYRTVHFGTAHVTQCAFREYLGRGFACAQYVWNIPSPYWESYPADNGDPASPCW